jgi:hypothetical protein
MGRCTARSPAPPATSLPGALAAPLYGHARGGAGLLPSPAPSEGHHRSLACRLVAVRRVAVLVEAVGQRPHPRRAHGRGGGVEDAADDSAIGEHVEVIIVPLAGWATSRRALEDQFAGPCP